MIFITARTDETYKDRDYALFKTYLVHWHGSSWTWQNKPSPLGIVSPLTTIINPTRNYLSHCLSQNVTLKTTGGSKLPSRQVPDTGQRITYIVLRRIL